MRKSRAQIELFRFRNPKFQRLEGQNGLQRLGNSILALISTISAKTLEMC
jgi:hypothetical protein